MSIVLLGLLMEPWTCPTLGQAKPTPAELVRDLQSEATADQAGQELRKTAKSDPAVRQYLIVNLPPIIEKGPKSQLPAWKNAVQMAGDLEIVEAAPALAKWLGLDTGPPITDMHRQARLQHSWPGKALFQIGDPAIPFVQPVLARGTSRERWTAAYLLSRIGSRRAHEALRKHLAEDEPDATLRDYIRGVLSK